MPVHFIPDPGFVWPPLRPAEVPAPAPRRRRKKRPAKAKAVPKRKPRKRKPKRRRPRPKISAQCRTILIDRLEAAVVAGRVDLHDDFEDCDQLCITGGEYALLMLILFPEEYRGPRKKAAKPTLTPPASAERIAEYAQRVSDGRPVTAKGDAGAVHPRTGEQIVLAERKNGTGLRVVGWGEIPVT